MFSLYGCQATAATDVSSVQSESECGLCDVSDSLWQHKFVIVEHCRQLREEWWAAAGAGGSSLKFAVYISRWPLCSSVSDSCWYRDWCHTHCSVSETLVASIAIWQCVRSRVMLRFFVRSIVSYLNFSLSHEPNMELSRCRLAIILLNLTSLLSIPEI